MKRAILFVVVTLVAATACTATLKDSSLASVEHRQRLEKSYEAVWKKLADTLTLVKKPLGKTQVFAITPTNIPSGSGQTACDEARKHPSDEKNPKVVLVCSEDNHHAVVVKVLPSGQPDLKGDPLPVMFNDATLNVTDAGYFVVSVTIDGQLRTSSGKMSASELKRLDDALLQRWREGYEQYFHQPLPQ